MWMYKNDIHASCNEMIMIDADLLFHLGRDHDQDIFI